VGHLDSHPMLVAPPQPVATHHHPHSPPPPYGVARVRAQARTPWAQTQNGDPFSSPCLYALSLPLHSSPITLA